MTAEGKEGADADAPSDEQLLRRLEEERRQLEQGEHPMLEARKNALETVKQDRIGTARRILAWEKECAENTFSYTCHAAEDRFRQCVRDAREDLLRSVRDRVADVRHRLYGPTHPPPSSRTLRSRAKPTDDDEMGGGTGGAGGGAGGGGGGGRGNDGFAAERELDFTLKNEHVMADLREVYSDWKRAAQRFQQASGEKLVPARASRNSLLYRDESFQPGDAVVVISELTSQEFRGSFLGCNPVEAGVRLDDGTKARLPLAHLRQSRITIRHDDNDEDDNGGADEDDKRDNGESGGKSGMHTEGNVRPAVSGGQLFSVTAAGGARASTPAAVSAAAELGSLRQAAAGGSHPAAAAAGMYPHDVHSLAPQHGGGVPSSFGGGYPPASSHHLGPMMAAGVPPYYRAMEAPMLDPARTQQQQQQQHGGGYAPEMMYGRGSAAAAAAAVPGADGGAGGYGMMGSPYFGGQAGNAAPVYSAAMDPWTHQPHPHYNPHQHHGMMSQAAVPLMGGGHAVMGVSNDGRPEETMEQGYSMHPGMWARMPSQLQQQQQPPHPQQAMPPQQHGEEPYPKRHRAS